MNVLMLLTPKKLVTYVLDTQDVSDALFVIKHARYSSIPLLNSNGKYLGTLSEGDLLWHLENEVSGRVTKLADVKRIRDNEAKKVSSELDEIFISSLGQNFIPIIDDREMFIGIVTRKSIIAHYVDLLAKLRGKTLPRDVEVIDAILNRRSIRQFKDEKIDDSVLDTLIKAGLAAPSAKNRMPIHILLLDDKKRREEIYQLCPTTKLIESSPYAFLIFGDVISEPNAFVLNNDASAVIENILIAISGLNLGGVWVGVNPENENTQKINKLFSIDPRYVLHGAIAFGVSNENKERPVVNLEEKIHKNEW